VAVIVGSRRDPHVGAVLEHVRGDVVVLDAETFLTRPFILTGEGLVLDGVTVRGPGWLRRLAGPDWIEPLRGGDLDGAIRQSAVSALATFLRDDRSGWLTTLDQVAAAENKPWQYRRADQVCPVPAWLITTQREHLSGDGTWVAKPLGPGHFFDGEAQPVIVPTQVVTEASLDAVAGAPFLYQHRIQASVHARVVTVGNAVFSATLPADGLPDDWRLSTQAHESFTDDPAPALVHEQAIAVARACHVGYSSQDWIRDTEGTWWFVDLNPAGQWLFLPTGPADSVSLALARWLEQEVS
jgi:hypothetical protein